MEAAATAWSCLALKPWLRPQERAAVKEMRMPKQDKQPLEEYLHSELQQKRKHLSTQYQGATYYNNHHLLQG